VALSDEPAGLNWMDQTGDMPGTNIMVNINDYLGRLDYTSTGIVSNPELALEWWQETPTTWILKLREGVQFQRGYGEMTAEDVAFGPNTVIQENMNYAWMISVVDHWEPIDKYTVRACLKEPFTPFLMTSVNGFGGSVVSKKAYQELGRDAISRSPVGVGPFELEEWVPGDHITLKKNQAYWDEGYPLVDRVIFRFIPDPTVREELLRAGDVDIIDHPDFKDVKNLEADPNIVVQSIPGWNWDYITFANMDGPFGDKRVRQAVSYALDREEIADAVYYGQATPGEKALPPGFLYEDPSISKYSPTPNIERAKELLAEAGYPNGFEATAITSDKANLRRELEIVAFQLAKVGIKLEIQFLDNASFATRSHQTGGADDILLEDITIVSGDPDSAIRWFWHTDGSLSHGYSNVIIDRLIDAGGAETDPAIRSDIYKALQRKMLDESLYVYTVHVNQVRVMRKEVTGFQVMPSDIDLWLKYVDITD